MSKLLFVVPFFFIIVALVLSVYIMIGVYVYKDAGKRGMNKVLWTLIALFVPSFLGLVAYLVVRNNSISISKCPQCLQIVRQDYEICPNCGFELMQTCDNCGKAVSRDWKMCPWCRHELLHYHDFSDPFTEPERNNKRLVTILAVVAVLFIIIMGLMIAVPIISYQNIQIMSTETNWGNVFSHKYEYFSGTKERSIHLSSGQTADINVDTEIEKGELVIEIKNSNGRIIKTISDSGTETIRVNAERDETYLITVKGKKTTGSYRISWDIIK